MNAKILVKTIKKNKKLPKYIKNDLVKILKSDLYTDTLTIISTLTFQLHVFQRHVERAQK